VIDLAYLIRRSAASFPNTTLADDGVRILSMQNAAACESALRTHWTKSVSQLGAHVGVLSENRSEYVAADLAIALARRVRVALNARLHLDDHRYVAEDCEMRVLIHSARFAQGGRGAPEEFGLIAISFDENGAVGGPTFEALAARRRPVSVP